MRKSAAKALSVLLCGALLAAGSCAMGQTYPVTVDGRQIRAGIYILKQDSAVSDARAKIKDEQPDLDTSAQDFDYKKQTVEGVSFPDWVENKTIQYCKEYVAVDKLFDEYGLTLSEDTVKEIRSYSNNLWTMENSYAQYIYGVSVIGDYYEGIGVSEESFTDFRLNSEKYNEIFDHLYGEGGEKAMTADEINAKIKEDYIAVNYFEYELTSGESAQAYADMITSGKSFEEVYQAYSTAKKKEDIEADKALAEANGEEYTGETEENINVELPAADSLIKIVKKDSTSPSEELVKQMSDMADGETKVITVTQGEGDTASTTSYVVSKIDILTKPDLTSSYNDTIIHEAKDEEFEAFITEKADSLSVSKDGSISMYKVDKLLR